MNTVRVDLAMQEETPGILAKAEWELQLRAKLEEREKHRAEQLLLEASDPQQALSTQELLEPPKPSMTLGGRRIP
eukprot:Skav223867  [mRNA]  locus=scaffold1226:162057:163461:- [translate_table: standard]